MVEIIALVFGIIILIRGKVGVGGGHELLGWRARVVGGILLSHLLISFIGGVILGIASVSKGNNGEVSTGAVLAISLSSLIIVGIAAFVTGKILYKGQVASEQKNDPHSPV